MIDRAIDKINKIMNLIDHYSITIIVVKSPESDMIQVKMIY